MYHVPYSSNKHSGHNLMDTTFIFITSDHEDKEAHLLSTSAIEATKLHYMYLKKALDC